MFDGAWVIGRFHDVSEQDIQQAIAVCAHGGYVPKVKPRQIEVVGRNEIHVYWFKGYEGYDIAKRVRGRWNCEETVVVTG